MPRLLAINAVAEPGGAEIGLLRLLERLPHWDVTITTPGAGALADRARSLGARVERVRLGGLEACSGARAVLSWGKIARLARRHDVAYFNGTVAARGLPAAVGRARVVLHVHDLVDRVGKHWAGADVVLADSQAVADRLAPLAAEVVYCPVVLGVPPAPEPPWQRKKRDGALFSTDAPVIGYIGRIEPRKGVLDLVRAAPLIRAAVPGSTIVVVGADTYGADRRYGAAVSASTDVEHYDWVPDAASLMHHLDVLVLPSYAEPFGTVVAEAMAAGTPVVATTVGGLPEVVRNGIDGVLVPPGRPDALAAGVERVLADRGLMGAAAAAAASRFDANLYALRVEQLLAA